MNCPKCGNVLEEGASFCNNCGSSVTLVETAPVAPAPVAGPIETPKKSKLPLVIVLLIVFLALGLVGGFFLGKSLTNKDKCKVDETVTKAPKEEKTEEEKKDEEKKEDDAWEYKERTYQKIDATNIPITPEDDELSKGIEVTNYMYNEVDHSLHVLAKNNNKVPVRLNLYLNFLDASGTRIGRESCYSYVDVGRVFTCNIDSSYKEEKFASVSMTVSASKFESYYHMMKIDESKISVNEIEGGMYINYENTNKDTITGYLTVIYYKNNKIAYYEDVSFFDVKPGLKSDSRIYTFYFPNYDENKKLVKDYYDKYEVKVSAIYHYENDY